MKTITNISGAEQTAVNDLNENFQDIQDSLDTKHSTNQDLDLDNNDIINGKSIKAESLFLNGVKVAGDVSAFISVPLVYKGAWATSTVYQVNDTVDNNGSSYICKAGHTASASSEAGVGATSSTYWVLLASKGDQGASGGGSGDLIAANNLSDVPDVPTAQANLDLEVGVDVQAHSNFLDDISALSLSQGDILYYNGFDIVKLSPGVLGQVLTTNGVGNDPTWGSPSGIKLWESDIKRLANSVGPTGGSTYVSLDTIVRATVSPTSRISVMGAVDYTAGSASGDRDGFRAELEVDGVTVETQSGYSGGNSTFSKTIKFHYTPGDTGSHTYRVKFKSLPGNAIWTQSSTYYYLEELSS